jgi:hypothetical protein
MCGPVGQVPGTLIDWAAGVIGVPCQVVVQQITLESGGRADAVSPTGALGPAQFEPGTWRSQGCAGSPTNVTDAMKCYAKFMYQLVQQFHGNVRDALAAYNAGPGNLQAGYGYADAILAAAGQSSGLAAGAGNPGAAAPGGAGTVLTAAQQQQSSAGPDCAWSLGGQHIGLLFGHGPSLPSACVIRKTEVRALIGGLLLVMGGLVVLPGVIIVVAYGLRATGATRGVEQAAGAIPGYGAVVRRVTGGAGGGYQVTDRTPLGGQMGGTRTVRYASRRPPRPPGLSD